MNYNPNEIEKNWQKYWAENQTFKAENNSDKPKYYVLDMFPYPSGAGLHVGHPLGYIASDIVARYKRHQGFNVLHPQGYDSFGLPAEQYAIQTGQHPDTTTKENITRYREQLDKIGFSFDWSREIRTSNPDYYKHTQWIFIQLFNSWYNKASDKAEDISTLIALFEQNGNATVNAVCDEGVLSFSAEDWNAYNKEEQERILLQYRLTYLAETEVNWCPGLGTVLANDEIVNGVSERGGHPVVRKKMTQWSMRISAYAERLLQGLETVDWTDSLKESQRNWIGKSVGATVRFPLLTSPKGGGTDGPGYMTGNKENANLLLENAKRMRKEPTEAESLLWEELRNNKLGFKFRRQHLIGNFIGDFVCLDKKLVVEVDGDYHLDPEQKEKDNERTIELEEKHGFKVIRFTNDNVKFEISEVLSKIKSELELAPSPSERVGERMIEVFTTRPDTIFGVTFMTLAPEHDLVRQITTPEQKEAVEAYIEATAKRSERERMADVKTISGVFTGAYAEHPFTKEPIPVWIGDYVLAGYGTGAVMAVPCGDERDYAFAKFFEGKEGMLPIKNIFDGVDISKEAFGSKEGVKLMNSDFLDGMNYKKATKQVIFELEKAGQGEGKTNYRLRDAVFSRQRYWGEPFPVYYVNGLPQMIDKAHLPIVLPEVEKYLPTEDGQPPLGNAKEWYWNTKANEVCSPPSEGVGEDYIFPLELNTMPGWAGSSWYWMRYMDANNEGDFASEEALKYWENVDLYIGGSEHATGHLLYSRFWNKFLKDRGFAPTEEPFKKLINQGMILGNSAFVYRLKLSVSIIGTHGFGNKIQLDYINQIEKLLPNVLVSENEIKNKSLSECNDYLKEKYLSVFSNQEVEKKLNELKVEDSNIVSISVYVKNIDKIHVDLSVINDITNELDLEAFRNHTLYKEYKEATFIMESGKVLSFGEDLGEDKYIVGREVEKMSKSKYNVVNPDDICAQYGADTLRLYEMFLGPLEQAKPWNTAGISGVSGFLKKLWKLYCNDSGVIVKDEEPSKEMYKSLHKTIKKVTEDIENFSFNTSVSQFMICVNELTQLKCNHRAILEPLAILVSPYAPHIAEELWSQLGHEGSIATVPFPKFEEKYLVESDKVYPVSFNGKMRFKMTLPLDLSVVQIEERVLADERTQQQLAGRTPKKVIIVPGKIINLVG